MNMDGWDKLFERLLDHDAYLKMTDKIHFIMLSS